MKISWSFIRVCLSSLILFYCTCCVSSFSPLADELFPKGKPVGQPYTRTRPDIRIVRVESAGEADCFYCQLCGENEIMRYGTGGEEVFYCKNQKTSGCMIYTRPVSCGTHEVGIIHIYDTAINRAGITEVRFVETVKVRSKERHKNEESAKKCSRLP